MLDVGYYRSWAPPFVRALRWKEGSIEIGVEVSGAKGAQRMSDEWRCIFLGSCGNWIKDHVFIEAIWMFLELRGQLIWLAAGWKSLFVPFVDNRLRFAHCTPSIHPSQSNWRLPSLFSRNIPICLYLSSSWAWVTCLCCTSLALQVNVSNCWWTRIVRRFDEWPPNRLDRLPST
jgi:hypothetical protein